VSDIKILEQRALEIRRKYDQLERDRKREPWDVSKLTRDIKKDISDLMTLIDNPQRDSRELGHELGECLWRLLLIARKLDIDLERAFWTQMGNLEQAAEETKS
jgi:NTP pyrophosphatase (non-canonical NTP hydrolase)